MTLDVGDLDGAGDMDIISTGWSYSLVVLYEKIRIQRAGQL
jgi:hypothetical protein